MSGPANKRPFQQAFSVPSSDLSTQEGPEITDNVKQIARSCTECGATSTPQWRQGPAGPQTLCNACGVRYSRLVRRSKPNKRSKPTPQLVAHPQDGSEGSVSEDTSKGTTILMPPPGTANGSPAGSPARTQAYQPPAGLPSLVQAGTATPQQQPIPIPIAPVAATRSVRQAALAGAAARAGFTAALLQPTPAVRSSSRRGSSTGMTRTGSGRMKVKEEELDCEAALNLLSMAAGVQPCVEDPDADEDEHEAEQEKQLQQVQQGTPYDQQLHMQSQDSTAAAPGPASASTSACMQEPCQPPLDVLSLVGHGDALQRLMPALNPDERHHLRQLCEQFDNSFKELVAAQAACEAVSQVLRAKQEEARLAQLGARSAAQMLLFKAAELSCHDTVLSALSAAARQTQDARGLGIPIVSGPVFGPAPTLDMAAAAAAAQDMPQPQGACN